LHDQPANGGLRFLRRTAVIVSNQPDFPAVDTAGGIDLVDRDLDAVALGRAQERRGSRQRTPHSDDDFFRGDSRLRHGRMRGHYKRNRQ
jgi:hypothetical protein